MNGYNQATEQIRAEYLAVIDGLKKDISILHTQIFESEK